MGSNSMPDPTDAAAGTAAGSSGDVRSLADTARGYVEDGKRQFTKLIDDVETTIRGVAAKFDVSAGLPVSGYIHRAGDQVGAFSAAVSNKSVDELASDARALIPAYPRVAAVTALVAGFVLIRLFKSGDNGSAPRHDGSS